MDQKSWRHPAGACMRKAALPAFVRLLFAFPSDATHAMKTSCELLLQTLLGPAERQNNEEEERAGWGREADIAITRTHTVPDTGEHEHMHTQ